MRFNEPKFPECVDCVRFNARRPSKFCPGCDAGEFFLERQPSDEPPDSEELMDIFALMEREQNDG